MKPHRRSIPTMLYPILLAAGAVSCIATRPEEEAGTGKLPEDFSHQQQEALRKEIAAAQDPELERFYQASGYRPLWQNRRPEIVGALMAAGDRGLKPADYLKAQSELGVTKALMQYVGDLRFGRTNPGTYSKQGHSNLSDLALAV